MNACARIACLAMLCLLWSVAASAAERILDYHVDIRISADSTLTVVEHIRVNAEGRRIRHGIYRDIPTLYHDRLGNRYHIDFNVTDATRDGQPERWRSENRSNGVRVYLGSRDTLLSSGNHDFTLTYRVNRELGFFDDHDELYWNVTGNGWGVAIEHASADVHLPVGVTTGELKAYGFTGRQGSHERALTVALHDDGAAYATTRALSPGEGFSVVLQFPKGIVAEPSAPQRLTWLLRDNRSLLLGLLGLTLLWLYYIWAWRRYGRDPAAGVRIPLYEPPDGDSASALRYIRRMGWDNTCFTAGVLGLAAKGALTIEHDSGKNYTLTEVGRPDNLTPDERVLNSKLFADGPILPLARSARLRITGACDALKRRLSLTYEKKSFLTHRDKLIPGLGITLITLIAIVMASENRAIAAFMCLWLSGWTFGTAMLLFAAWRGVRNANSLATRIGGVFTGLFAIPFLIGELFGLGIFGSMAGYLTLPIFLALIGTNIAFYQWMKAPTQDGARLLDKIEGFRWYLGVAEKQELDARYKPESRPELFARYLPYAVALDLGNAWAQRFAEALTPQQLQQAQPTWYRGSDVTSFGSGAGLAAFSAGLSSGLSGAISSASTPPGSSSGGGGFSGGSGGGGGGGGGGGW